MRRIRHWLPRYVLTGATTAMAFFLFLQVATTTNLLLHSIGVDAGAQTVEQQLAAAAAEINTRCPMNLDDETRVDSVSCGPGKVLTYHYSLVKRSVGKLDIPHLQEAIRPGIANNVKVNPDLDALRGLQATFVYKYVDKAGRPAFDITVSPPDYR